MFKVIDRFGYFLKNWTISKKVLAGIFVVGFVVSLIPIIITCFYSVPVYDDYTLSYSSHLSIVEGKSFISGVVSNCINLYFNWQGFMLSNLWPAIQPFVFDSNLYFISNLVVIFSFIFSLFYFSKSILINTLKVSITDYFLITIPIVELIIQLLPSIAEGFYWMDGSLSIFINAIVLCDFALLLNCQNYYDNFKKRIIYIILAILLMLIIFMDSPLSFVTMIVTFIYSIIYSVKKHYSIYKLIIVLSLIYIFGIIIAIVAPGNQVRLSSGMSENAYSLIEAVFYALFYSFTCLGEWISLCFIAILSFISVIFYNYAKKSKFSFRNPLLVFVLCYSIYSVRMFVQLYAGGYLGSPRQMNQYYLGFVLTFTITFLYFIGWLSKTDLINTHSFNQKKISVLFLVFVVFLFGAGCFDFGVKEMATVSTTLSFVKGETQQYSFEMKERIALYENDEIKDVVVTPLSVYPSIFMKEPIKEDQNYWTNRSVAKYYNKKSVKLSKQE